MKRFLKQATTKTTTTGASDGITKKQGDVASTKPPVGTTASIRVASSTAGIKAGAVSASTSSTKVPPSVSTKSLSGKASTTPSGKATTTTPSGKATTTTPSTKAATITPTTNEPITTPDDVGAGNASEATPTTETETEQCAEADAAQKSGKKELIPGVFWFSKSIVATGVSESFKAHYNHPYTSWTQVPKHVRDHWFDEFKREFTWNPKYDNQVRTAYEKKGVQRLKDLVNKCAKIPLDKKIEWMSDTIRAELNSKRKGDTFLLRSDRAKKNRLSEQSMEDFDPGHRQGSVSTIEVTERMAKKNGEFPSAADVYEVTHGVELTDGDNLLIGERAKKTMVDYEEKLAEYKEKGIEKEPDDVFLEVVGGVKKGKVYGLGSASSMFYKTSKSSNSDQIHTSSLISQLCTQVEESKKVAEESKKVAEECKKVAEESKQVAADSLKLAQATKEAHEKEKVLWEKEKNDYKYHLLILQKKVYEMSQKMNDAPIAN